MVKALIDKLNSEKSLTHAEWCTLLENFNESDRKYAETLAREIATERFGKNIYFRGIIEFTNICKNDCYYCGIRRSNCCVQRYRLSKEEILECASEGYKYGFRTFVLQGGEDGSITDEFLCDIISSIKELYPDCAVTLSVGERSTQSYEKLKSAGADRYLLRHEAANKNLYEKIHPEYQSYDERMRCLFDLKKLGFQTGCGFMVGVPYQTISDIADDLIFIQDFKPHMIGLGPFIPHKDTPFKDYAHGNIELTLMLMSLSRIMLPDVLLPATTALGSVRGDGRQLGVLAGCNVVMPNLSPLSVRKKYMLYDGKAGTESDAKSGIEMLKHQMEEIGYNVVCTRGDHADKK